MREAVRSLRYTAGFLTLLLVVSLSRAQEPLRAPRGEPQKPPLGEPGPNGGIGFVGFGMGFEHGVITGAPFAADFTASTTQTFADGNVIHRQSSGRLARDSQGRTWRQLSLASVGPWAPTGGSRQAIFINDPVAGVRYVLNPDNNTGRSAPAGGMAGGRPVKGEQARAYGPRRPFPAGEATTESLGSKVIDGVTVEGSRETRTIPAGQIGNEKPIQIVSERWYSPELHINVMTKRTDPRFGTTSYELTNLQRREPDAGLFKVPSGYTVQPAEPGRPGRRPGPIIQRP